MKKLVVFLLIVVLAIAFTVPALAADTVSVRLNGNGNNARLEITVNGEMQSFPNPGNATKVFEVNGLRIEVVTQGNSVRSFRNLGSVAPAAPVPLANNSSNSGQSGNVVPTTPPAPGQTHRVNVSFHCNDIEGGGNGRVWTGYEGQQTLTRSADKQPNGNAIWTLSGPVCTCGRTDWVNFSNNSGVPNGNNIQLNHNGPSRRNITVTVTYTIFIPECKDIVCGFVCNEVACEDDCGECTVDKDDCVAPTDCDAECNFEACGECPDHVCPPCKCAVNARQVIVNERRTVRFMATNVGPVEGFNFKHEAPATWRGGATASAISSRFIDEVLFNSKAYVIDYRGVGDCTPCDYACAWIAPICVECECEDCVPFDCGLVCDNGVCEPCDGGSCDKNGPCDCECICEGDIQDEECIHVYCPDCGGCVDNGAGCEVNDFCEGDHPDCCKPCICKDVPPPCKHLLVCSVCYNAADKGLQNQSHPGCHNAPGNGSQNTFFCLHCDYKETHWNNGNNPAPVGYCNCPVCCN